VMCAMISAIPHQRLLPFADETVDYDYYIVLLMIRRERTRGAIKHRISTRAKSSGAQNLVRCVCSPSRSIVRMSVTLGSNRAEKGKGSGNKIE